ncbi:hypothetical protein KZC51_08465 [Microbacterium sp. SSW1-49]|uniref:Uncharacterized protein n=1 Tax=Microbacterium croceum TaxID=2851645 RepID=A0ABT0FE53_9MICO|nr:hypothetical protein [Microbacterium croceum]MCK2036169.1 hypothetical protein [Microbacterium croceum]
MIRRVAYFGVLAGLVVAVCVGCDSAERGEKVDESLTWEDAKATTQDVMKEIADLVPADVVVGVEHQESGRLFSCDPVGHRWKGVATVTIQPGTDIDAVVREIEQAFNDDSRFEMSSRTDGGGAYELHLTSSESAEGYLVGELGEETIQIDGGSACFVLPDDVYPGGKF